MVDIPATSSTPLPTPATVSPASVIPVAAVATNIPEQIQNLSRQIEITGTISLPPQAGQLVLTTALGNLTIILPQLAELRQEKLLQILISMFQNSKPLTVVIQPGNPPNQVLLLLPNTSSPLAPSTAYSTAFQNGAQPPVTLTAGSSYSAVLLPQSPSISLTPNAAPQNLEKQLLSTYGVGLTNKGPVISENLISPNAPILSPSAPALSEANTLTLSIIKPSQLPTPNIGSATVPEAVLSTLKETIPARVTGSFSDIPISTSLRIPIAESALNIQEPALNLPSKEIILRIIAEAPSNNIEPPTGSLFATVVNKIPNGGIIFKINDTVLFIKQNITAPIGSNWIVTLDTLKSTSPIPLPLPNTEMINNIQELLSFLSSTNPALAQQVLNSSIPQPGPALPATLLFLMSAFKQGSLRSWIGDNAVDTLGKFGKTSLMKALSLEIKEGGQLVRDNIVGEWRSYNLPLQSFHQFHVLNFYVHDSLSDKSQHKKSDTNDKEYVRFLIDMRLSRLGPVQLDGLVRRKQLDIIVRSEQELPTSLQQQLRLDYTNTMSALGYSGSLAFQVGRQNWLIIKKSASLAKLT